MTKLKVTQIRSAIGHPKKQKATLIALGIKRLNNSVELDESPQILGMINKVQHLVKVDKI